MLGKLFKYEMKALGRILMPLYAAWIAVAIMLGLSITFLEDSVFFTGLTSLLYAVAAFASVFTTIFLIVSRFVKNIFGAEGYMMLTLPVKTSTHIWTKALASTLFGIIGICFGIISGLAIAFVTVDSPTDLFKGIFIGLSHIFDSLNGFNVSIILLTIAIGIAAIFETIIKVYAAISIGHSFNSHKILLSIAIYIGFGIIESIAINALGLLGGNFDLFAFTESWNYKTATVSALGFALVSICIMSAIYFLVTRLGMKNKLNLE